MEINELSGKIIEAALRVHTVLGPGMLESAYETCLAFELLRRGMGVERQKPLPLVYDGIALDAGYRLDMLVNGDIIVELKAVEKIHPLHEAQLLSYLRLSGKTLGLLINFNVLHLRDGIRRMVNNYSGDDSADLPRRYLLDFH
jgi:GxxExxY protein